MMREVLIAPQPGLGMLAMFLGGMVLGGLMLVGGGIALNPFFAIAGIAGGIVCLVGLTGLFTVSPNEHWPDPLTTYV